MILGRSGFVLSEPFGPIFRVKLVVLDALTHSVSLGTIIERSTAKNEPDCRPKGIGLFIGISCSMRKGCHSVGRI